MWRWALALLLTGCFASEDPDDAPAPATTSVAIGADGRSDELTFEVPDGARSVTVLVQGSSTAYVALSSLVWSDGTEAIALDPDASSDLARVATSSYPIVAGTVPQFVREGTFIWLYPRVVEQPLPPGPARLRVVSTDAGGQADVTVLAPPDDGANVLHVVIATASDRFAWTEAPAALAFAQSTFERAGVDLVVDDVVALDGTGVGPFLGDRYPTPDGPESVLLRRVRGETESNGLALMVVDPFDAVGYTLGLPGAPLADADYSGVLVSDQAPGAGDPDAKLGHVIAHEIAHNLGLTHLVDWNEAGEEVLDAFDDTGIDDRNLMGSIDQDATPTDDDTVLTPRQEWALSRSAWLRLE